MCMFNKKMCYKCKFGKYIKSSILGNTYFCLRNPSKPINMGFFGSCENRTRMLEEQYVKEDSL